MQKRAKPRTAPQPGLEPGADDHNTISKQNRLPRSAKSYCKSEIDPTRGAYINLRSGYVPGSEYA
jgi:hypothetical protein